MNWKRPQNWLMLGLAVLALFAIYTFASPDDTLRPQELTSRRTASTTRVVEAEADGATPGLVTLRTDLLEPESETFRSGRNLFAFVEPPPPPPPPLPPPPKDRDKDGIPDYQDNCPDVKNVDQGDIDRDGVGTLCEKEAEIAPPPPPPPPPRPPDFPYKYLGTFGTASRPIATFANNGEIVNVRLGETFGGGRFTLVNIGIESVDIGFPGFPPDVKRRIPIGQ